MRLPDHSGCDASSSCSACFENAGSTPVFTLLLWLSVGCGVNLFCFSDEIDLSSMLEIKKRAHFSCLDIVH